ncbi:hypothetical protein, partial [Sideroxydans sp.]
PAINWSISSGEGFFCNTVISTPFNVMAVSCLMTVYTKSFTPPAVAVMLPDGCITTEIGQKRPVDIPPESRRSPMTMCNIGR